MPFLNLKKYIIAILFVLGSFPFLIAEEPDPEAIANRGYATYKDIPERKKGTVIIPQAKIGNISKPKAADLTALQSQARLYRNQGLQLQEMGNLEEAMGFYQKAIELDPAYAVVYNDLGIIYEAMGSPERAEASYQKCLKIDPEYLSAYSNLALLYENKREFDQAVFYWKKRAELGLPDDPWTQKAKQRLADIQLVQEGPADRAREQEIINFMEKVASKKTLIQEDDKAAAQKKFAEAKEYYRQEDFATAIKVAVDAQQLDPANKEIEKFIDQTRTRALSR